MNTKQKIFTFTSIGVVFATAIAFVAITGAKNLEQLKAENEIVYGTSYTLVIDKDSITDSESKNNYHILTISTKTKSGWDFTTDDTVEGMGILNSPIGESSIVDYKDGIYPYIQFNFHLRKVHSKPDCTLKGDFSKAYKSINWTDDVENEIYAVTIYVEGKDIGGGNYGGFTLTSIEFTYDC